MFISGFAALKFSEQGKGALFIFCNVSLPDLIADDEDHSEIRGRFARPVCSPSQQHLDRQVVLVWGTTAGSNTTGVYSARQLRQNFKTDVGTRTLDKSMIDACSEEYYPVVLVCDPEQNNMPNLLRGQLTQIANSSSESGCRISTVISRHCDFAVSLKHGCRFKDVDAFCLNLDRD